MKADQIPEFLAINSLSNAPKFSLSSVPDDFYLIPPYRPSPLWIYQHPQNGYFLSRRQDGKPFVEILVDLDDRMNGAKPGEFAIAFVRATTSEPSVDD